MSSFRRPLLEEIGNWKQGGKWRDLRDFCIGAYYFEKEGRFDWRSFEPTVRPFLADSGNRRRRDSNGTCSRSRNASCFVATKSCSASWRCCVRDSCDLDPPKWVDLWSEKSDDFCLSHCSKKRAFRPFSLFAALLLLWPARTFIGFLTVFWPRKSV